MPSTSTKIKNIVIVQLSGIGTGGGDVHLNILSKIWKENGIAISKLSTDSKFNFKNNLKYFLTGTDKLMKFTNANPEILKSADLIISNSPFPQDLNTAIKLARRYKKPVICYFHHITPNFFIHPLRRGIFRVFLNRTYIYYSLHLVKKNHIAIFLDQPQTFKRKDIKVYRDDDAVNVPKLPDFQKEFDMCYIGRLTKPKGIYDLICVAKILRKKNINLKIAVIGSSDPKTEKKINKILKESGIDDYFLFLGYVSNEKKYELLKKSKIFVSLSYEEGWSLAVMEAAMLKIPIVAYKLDAYSYLRGNYFDAPLGDISKISDIIENILLYHKNLDDNVKNAFDSVRNYNYEDIALQQLEYFRQFLTTY